MRSISGLKQLESLCLHDVCVSYPEAAAQLKVTSLTLESVKLSQPQTQLLHGREQQYQGPYWAKLTTVQLAGFVSEQLLQAMLLPHPAAAGLNVRISFEMFDGFDSDLTYVYKDTYKEDVRYYCADTAPILGPAYLAVARKTPVVVLGTRLQRHMKQSKKVKTTDGFARQNAPGHMKHHAGRGVKAASNIEVHGASLHKRLDKAGDTKLTADRPGQNAADHVEHDFGRGIKTREHIAADHVEHDVGRGIKTREQNAADHVDHDVGRGIKTRDKPSSRQATKQFNGYGKRFVLGATVVMCLVLALVCWLLSR